MKRHRLFFYLAIILSATACSPRITVPTAAMNGLKGNAGLQSGPMLGYADMFEVLIWVQTKSAGTVKIEYWDSEKPEDRKSVV